MLQTVIGILLIITAVFLIIAVLLQSGKDKGLAASIGGSSSDTYYGKNKGNTKDRILNKLTTVVAIVFALLVLVSFIIQDNDTHTHTGGSTTASSDTSKPAESSSVEESSSVADSSTPDASSSDAE